VARTTLKGLLLGAAVGAVLAWLGVNRANAPPSSVDTIVMAGAVAVGAIGSWSGYRQGMRESFSLRLKAQTALCQVEMERNTRRLCDVMRDWL